MRGWVCLCAFVYMCVFACDLVCLCVCVGVVVLSCVFRCACLRVIACCLFVCLW